MRVFCLDVAYICMFASICFKCIRCFKRKFATVSCGCRICLQWFSSVFRYFYANVSIKVITLGCLKASIS
jgi:hypothetical protein